MASRGQIAGGVLGSVLAAASVAAPVVVKWEGWQNVGYPDPALGAKLATACAGVTEGIVLGHRYSDKDCTGRVALALVKTGLAIYNCLPADLPLMVRAGFTVTAYNIGPPKFCRSSIAVAARAGDLRTACTRINQRPDGKPQWIYAKIAGVDVPMPGLVARRADERAMCEQGLKA